jgi:hypothetical protein
MLKIVKYIFEQEVFGPRDGGSVFGNKNDAPHPPLYRVFYLSSLPCGKPDFHEYSRIIPACVFVPF